VSRDFDAWVIFVAAAATLAVLLQLGFVVALLFGMRTLSAKIREMRAKSSSGGPALRDLVTTARQTLDNINRVAKGTAELTERIKPVVEEATEVSHRQVARADQVVGDVLGRVERISEYVELGIAHPAREVKALSAAVRTALAVFFRHANYRKGRNNDRTSARQGRTPFTSTIVLLVLNLGGFFATSLRAQQGQQQTSYEGANVAYVDLVARPGTNLDALRPLIVQKAGEPYSNEKVQSSVAALEKAGQFSKVEVEVSPEAAGLRVAFVAQPAFTSG
jgi:hypothetical protein